MWTINDSTSALLSALVEKYNSPHGSYVHIYYLVITRESSIKVSSISKQNSALDFSFDCMKVQRIHAIKF